MMTAQDYPFPSLSGAPAPGPLPATEGPPAPAPGPLADRHFRRSDYFGDICYAPAGTRRHPASALGP